MSEINSNNKTTTLEMIERINHVDGFDPNTLAIEYMDLKTQATRKYLPVLSRLAWFYLKYPEGKVAVQVTQTKSPQSKKDIFVATARVYPSYKDSPDAYISEGTASRQYDEKNPTVSPREWAQTAAVGFALRNAGFGIQFSISKGEEDEYNAGVEFGFDEDNPNTSTNEDETIENGEHTDESEVVAPPVQTPKRELTPEEKFQRAIAYPCPIQKYADKTLGDMITLDPKALTWVADKFDKDPAIKAAAQFICEYAKQSA